MIYYLLPCGLAVYYFFAWLLAGRKRPRSAVVVRYTPPAGISPAMARYLYVLGCDGRTVAAILSQLSVRRIISIAPRKDGVYLKDLTNDGETSDDLPAEEYLVFKRLVRWEDSVRLEKPDWGLIQEVEEALQNSSGRRYINQNYPLVILGLIFTGLASTWLGLQLGLSGEDQVEAMIGAGFIGFVVAMFSAAGVFLWTRNLQAFKLAVRGLYHRWTLPLLVVMVFIFPAMWYFLMRTTAPVFSGVTLLLILVNTFGAPFLRNYTVAGREAMDQILGFRQFLEGTEQDRLDRLNPRDRAAQVDEQFMPYAIALDLREGWGDELGVRAMAETAL
ncbi:MAG: DUF2207 domain-containing protein [Acidobacteriia bacterium]|nr:DUF2207 domain-containing protein [Terriglobia bacterium]